MTPLLKFLVVFLMTVLLATEITPGIASAEMSGMDQAGVWADVTEEIDEAPGYEDPQKNDRKWAFSLGFAGGMSPDYEGSNDYSLGMGPNIAFSWQDTIFYKGKSLGVNLVRQKNLKAGPILSWTSGRSEDDNERLEGLGDVDGTIEAGGFVSYRQKPLRFRLEARQDVDSGHEGALVELSGGTTLPFEKPVVFVALGATWASDDYMDSFFGIDAQQSAASGLQRHKADAGIKDISLALTSGYPMTNRWRLGCKIEYARLLGDAADSPVVDSRNQVMAGISLSYHMGSKILPEELE